MTTCRLCAGSGTRECTYCDGDGVLRGFDVTCGGCLGSGRMSCDLCVGTGRTDD